MLTARCCTCHPQILHRFGGIWVDTDSVLLRDTRPLFEFAGEFAAKVTMSHYYNNNVLGLRKGSPVAKKMLGFVCETPYSRDTTNYCRTVGKPCYPKWYVAAGRIGIAFRAAVLNPISLPRSVQARTAWPMCMGMRD